MHVRYEHTQRLSFPRTTVATHKATAMYHKNPRMFVRRNTKQRHELLRAERQMVKASPKSVLAGNKRKCQKTSADSAVCAVWVLTPPALMSAISGSSQALKNFSRSYRERVRSMATIYSTTTRPPSIPSRRRRKCACLLIFMLEVSPCFPLLLLPLFDNFYSKMTF